MNRIRQSCIAAIRGALFPVSLLLYGIVLVVLGSLGIFGLIIYARWIELGNQYGSLPRELFFSVLFSATVSMATIAFVWRFVGLPTAWVEVAVDALVD